MAADGTAAGAWIGLLCLSATLLSVMLVRQMIRLAVMDVPDGRSAHDRPTPRGGGVGMVACVLLGVPAFLALSPSPRDRLPAAVLVLVAVLLLAAVSWLDDVRQFGFRAKLGAQGVASLLMVGAVLPTLPAWPLWVLAPLALAGVAWLMLATNAVNFIDGLNGLAAGSVALVCLRVAAAGWMLGDPLLAALASMAACGLIGFLPFNYPAARIFLGDVGSQVCGLLAGGFAILLLADDPRSWIALSVPLMLAGILWDVLFTLLRRLAACERLTQAHRGHLYQVAARAGVPAAGVALLHWSFVIWGGLSAAAFATRPLAAILATLLPQLAWTAFVRRRAARAGLRHWS